MVDCIKFSPKDYNFEVTREIFGRFALFFDPDRSIVAQELEVLQWVTDAYVYKYKINNEQGRDRFLRHVVGEEEWEGYYRITPPSVQEVKYMMIVDPLDYIRYLKVLMTI